MDKYETEERLAVSNIEDLKYSTNFNRMKISDNTKNKYSNNLINLINKDLDYVKQQISRDQKSSLQLKSFMNENNEDTNELSIKFKNNIIKISPLIKELLYQYNDARKQFDIMKGGILDYFTPSDSKKKYEQLKEIGNKLIAKLNSINIADKQGIKENTKIICDFDSLESKNIYFYSNKPKVGKVTDIISYTSSISKIPETYIEYIDEITGKKNKDKLNKCRVFTEIDEKILADLKKEEEEKQHLKSYKIAANLGFKLGDLITCTIKNTTREVTGIAKKFRYDFKKNKTYVEIEEEGNPKIITAGVKYCLNNDNNILAKVDKLKEKKYMNKQIDKLKKIIQQINNLNVTDSNYDIKLRNLNYEYNTIKQQIYDAHEAAKKRIKTTLPEAQLIPQTVNIEQNNDYNDELREVQKKRALLLELLQKAKPNEYYKMSQILNRKTGGNTFGSITNFNQKTGGNTFGSITNFNQKAGGNQNNNENIANFIQIQKGLNNDINLNDIINKSRLLLNEINKTI